MKIDVQHFKRKLQQEFEEVEKELKTVGRINPENPNDWEARPDRMDILAADENEVADKIESFEENMGILNQLETRYNELKKALDRLEKGTYGSCEVGGEQIEAERLEANPAATTCIKHMG